MSRSKKLLCFPSAGRDEHTCAFSEERDDGSLEYRTRHSVFINSGTDLSRSNVGSHNVNSFS